MEKRKIKRVARGLLMVGMLGILASCGSNKKVVSFEVSDAVKNANQFIADYSGTISSDYRNTYHLNAPIGWINDPNGFSEFNGKYNLFYQYNPYSGQWGPMHWGHQTTKDFVKWELEDVALAPDMNYDMEAGCFSGTAIEVDGKLYLAYTAASATQNQGLAYSYDGITYKKLDELLIDGSKLPSGFSNADFRDPKIFTRDGKYFIICGNKSSSLKQIIMFKADNVEGPYTYAGVVYGRNDIGGILECPDMITIGDKDVLIASPQGLRDDEFYNYQNNDSCIYQVGKLSTNTYKFFKDSNTEIEEFDKGASFYAAQTLSTKDGRSIMVAWMRSWEEPNVTNQLNWCGAMTLPRELTIADGHIYQAPVREIENYQKDKKTNNDVELDNNSLDLPEFSGATSRIKLEIKVDDISSSGKAGIELYKNSEYSTKLYYDKELDSIVLDRNNCGSAFSGKRYCKVNPIDGKIKLDIFLDVNSCEVFVNNGYYTMTSNIYAPSDCLGVSLYAKDTKAKFSGLEKYLIEVK